jgi:hypothetical protein
VKAWEDYQYRAAELLRRLGFRAEVNDPLQGPNGVVHRVDVSARMVFAGVPILWIVECKLWNRAIPKEKVSALKDIVNDLGADRGLLLSERGFQSGAVNLAAAKNITLSSLDELRVNAAEQLTQGRADVAHSKLWLIMQMVTQSPPMPRWARSPLPREDRTQWEEIRAEFAQRSTVSDLSEGLAELANRRLSEDHAEIASRLAIPHFLERLPSRSGNMWLKGLDPYTISEISGTIFHLVMALERGEDGMWPVVFETPGGPKLAWSMPQLLGVIEPAITRLVEHVYELEPVRRRRGL